MIISLLIVDDKIENIYSLKSLLQNIEVNETKIEQLNIIEATNGIDTLSIALEKEIDLIILDIQMPNMNGFEVAKFLKLNSKTKDIPIIFLTAEFKTEDFVNEGFKVGAVDYFTKPIEKFQFLNKINLYLSLFVKNKLIKNETNKKLELEKQLFHQARLAQMGEMISLIAHQWRQPLNIISTALMSIQLKSEMRGNDLCNNEKDSSFMNFLDKKHVTINMCVQELSKIIDDFRSFYTYKKSTNRQSINIPIENIVNMVKDIYKTLGIKIEISLKSIHNISFSNNELMQVVSSILQNSVDNFKSTKTYNPTIKISSYDKKDNVIVSISDNGGGIKREFINEIFNPYFTTKDKMHGTGLGLYMCKLIVEEHLRGKIYAKNETDGVCFYFEITKN